MTKKVALVTGGSSGIGYETALELQGKGYTVYAAARRLDRMKKLSDKGIKTLALDVTQEESMQQCIDTIISNEGRIDVLVNNAGYGSYGSVEDVPMSEARRQIEVNLFGLARMTQLVLPYMRKQHSGKIVNISSIGGKVYTYLGAWYHATKHAIEGFSDSLRLELSPFGVDVIVIEPGSIKTEWSSIAADNIDATSQNGAYKEIAHKVSKTMRDIGGSSPTVISKTIGKAVTARKPKTRYSAGKYASTFLILRRILSDRMFDRFIQSFYK